MSGLADYKHRLVDSLNREQPAMGWLCIWRLRFFSCRTSVVHKYNPHASSVPHALPLSTILNNVIRDDIAEEVVHAAVIARAINAQIISRVAHLVHDTMNKWPPGGVCWRGGGFKVGR